MGHDQRANAAADGIEPAAHADGAGKFVECASVKMALEGRVGAYVTLGFDV